MMDLRRWVVILATGFVSTSLAQPEVIDLPLQGLLKNQLHVSAPSMSLFFSVGALMVREARDRYCLGQLSAIWNAPA